MQILYGVLPYQYLEELGGVKGLTGKSFNHHALIKIKYIDDLKSGVLFAALIDNNSLYMYPVFHGEINHIIINPRSTRTISHIKPSSDNAKKKKERKDKNLFLTKKNWKQFIGRRQTLIKAYQQSI
ncbi:hypothetical protein WAX87_15435 (plasmid) [Photobacterium damselae subsp. damselae]|uniref:hypothetical protein n=1 Tax=Photobacterium damselae TaxID=38293 RepID=UPI00311AFCAD